MFYGVSRYAQVTGVAVCSLCLTWISFVLRAYVRIYILKFVGKEDWLTVGTMAIFTIFCSLCLRTTHFGLGAHIDEIAPEFLVNGFKIFFACELFYVISTTLTKLSIAAYFVRLASRKYQMIVIAINLAIAMVFSALYFLFLIFQCTPTSYFWTMYEHGRGGSCLQSPSLANVTYAHCAMSAITDWVFGILPVFFVWNMHMNPKTKISVVLILSLGFFASSATIVRIYYIYQLTITEDYSWEGINITKWSIVEPAIAITAMNIATLRPLFKSVFHFTSRRWETSLSDDESSFLQSNEEIPGRNSVRQEEFSSEFADLLGLSKVGVTTEIFAGENEAEQMQGRRIFNQRESPTKGVERGINRINNMDEMEMASGRAGNLGGLTKTTTVEITYR